MPRNARKKSKGRNPPRYDVEINFCIIETISKMPGIKRTSIATACGISYTKSAEKTTLLEAANWISREEDGGYKITEFGNDKMEKMREIAMELEEMRLL